MRTITAIVTIETVVAAPQPSPLDELVVPLDGTPDAERALPVPLSIATELGAAVRLITTQSDIGDQSPTAYLERVASGVSLPVTTEVLLDQPPAEAIAVVAATGRVGVCMATHARGRVLGALHQNIAEAVVDRVSGPVLLVGPACAAEPIGDGPLLLAHDGSDETTAATRSAIPLAAALGRAVDIVTVESAPAGKTADHPYATQAAAIQPLLDEAARIGVPAESRIVFSSHVQAGLSDAIEESRPSLIAMMTHHRDALARLREGSTTMAIVHDAKVPVLVAHAG